MHLNPDVRTHFDKVERKARVAVDAWKSLRLKRSGLTYQRFERAYLLDNHLEAWEAEIIDIHWTWYRVTHLKEAAP